MKKRVFPTILALALLLCALPRFPASVQAATGYDAGYSGGMAGDGAIFAHGLDVSAWQESGLNFQNFANAGYDYVILRCGTSYGKDKCFEEYYASAKAAGLDVGCYYYSYATSVSEAKEEAEEMMDWMGSKVFEYPIYFDYEDPSQSSISGTVAGNICRAFMDTLKDNGYLVGMYSMASWIEQDWVTTSGIRDLYEGWVAHLPSEANNTGITSNLHQYYLSKYSTRYGMHQYSFTTYVNGVGPFDANVAFKDYPAIVSTYGFNGYYVDEEDPVISDVVFSELSSAGYTVSCRVTDDGGVKRVAFPTWTTYNDQDDLADYFMSTQVGTKDGDIYTFRVNASDHNYETGLYETHIYAEDRAGNIVCFEIEPIEVRDDDVPPVISEVRYSDVSAAGYTISCKVTDDWGVNRVSFPTWTTYNDQDDLADYFLTTQLGERDGDWFTFRVNASDHNNETGEYATHIYAIDCAGNMSNIAPKNVEVRDDNVSPVISNVEISNITDEGYTVTCKITDDWGIQSVSFPTWTVRNEQDDIVDSQVLSEDGETYRFVVSISDHNNETGLYETRICATDCAGNTIELPLEQVWVGGLDKITLISASWYTREGDVLHAVKEGTPVKTLLKQFENEELEVVHKDGTVINGYELAGTGTTINLYSGDELLDCVTAVVMGDLDGNGRINSTDYMLVKSAFLKTFTMDDIETSAADVDGNGKIDCTDYIRIKGYFVGTYDL